MKNNISPRKTVKENLTSAISLACTTARDSERDRERERGVAAAKRSRRSQGERVIGLAGSVCLAKVFCVATCVVLDFALTGGPIGWIKVSLGQGINRHRNWLEKKLEKASQVDKLGGDGR